jgi:hypothetical protein
MPAPEIAVKAAKHLQAGKQSSWLKRNCEAIAVMVMSRPHISVIVFPPQAGGNWGEGHQYPSGLITKRSGCSPSRRQAVKRKQSGYMQWGRTHYLYFVNFLLCL